MKHLNGNYVLGLLESPEASSEAAAMLGIAKRHANKPRQRMKAEGEACLADKSEGRQRERKAGDETESGIMDSYSGKHDGFNSARFLEKPNIREKIRAGHGAPCRILGGHGVESPKARRKKGKDDPHPLRDRRKTFGEPPQTGAPIHRRLKGGDLRHALHGAMDDATGTVMGLCFDDEETISRYYHMLEKTMLIHGIPKAFRTDKRTVFAYSKPSEKDKQMENNASIQLKRRCSRSGMEIISASVPQTKGRIERLRGTLQSRLLNELALNKTTSIKDANRFLPKFEKGLDGKLAFDPEGFDNSFTPWNKAKEELGHCLSAQCARVVDDGPSFSLDCGECCLVDGKRKAIRPPED